jgi:hypothetical protein
MWVAELATRLKDVKVWQQNWLLVGSSVVAKIAACLKDAKV